MVRPALLLALLCLVAYWPTFSAGFIWDDDTYIETNPHLTSLPGLEKIWFQYDSEPQYYPLTHTTLWIEYHLWGLRPLGYHIDNLLLHAGSAILLWRLLALLGFPAPWAAAALFAVHPVQVETVDWATERKNVLSGFLYFLSLHAYLRTRRGKWILTGEEIPSAGYWYLLSLICFLGAILSKSVTATLPAVILLLAWWKRGQIRLRDLTALTPFLLAGAAMGMLTSWLEKHHVGAVGPDFDWITFPDRLCIAGRAWWFYLFKLIWPVKLTFIYPRWNIDAGQHPWQLLFAAAALGVLASLWLLRHRWGRGPLTAALYFSGTLVPALGFTNVFPMRYSYVADHFQYLACIGPLALLAALLSRIPIARFYSPSSGTPGEGWGGGYLHRERRTEPPPLPSPGVPGEGNNARRSANIISAIPLAAILITCCILSFLHGRVFHDRVALWSDTVQKNPNSPTAHDNYGDALIRTSPPDFDAAEKQYRIALQLRPDDPDYRDSMASLWLIRGQWAQAIQWANEELQLRPESPEPILHRMRAGPYFKIGAAYQSWSDQIAAKSPLDDRIAAYRKLAAENYRQAIAILPEYELAMFNLGVILDQLGDRPAAIAEFQQAIKVNPDSVPAHDDLGNAYLRNGDFPSAIAEYKAALRVAPNDARAWNNLGSAWAQLRNWDNAIACFQNAVKNDPNYAMARENLGQAIERKLDAQDASRP